MGWKDTITPPPVGSFVDRKDPLIPEQLEPNSWKDTVRPPGQAGPNKEMHRVIAKTSTPEQEALVQKVHEKTFLPKDIIRSDPRTAENFQQFRDIQKATSSAPATARFLSMAENMALARDKAKELAKTEQDFVGSLTSGVVKLAGRAVPTAGHVLFNMLGGAAGFLDEGAKAIDELTPDWLVGQSGGYFGRLRDDSFAVSEWIQKNVLESEALALPEDKRQALIDKPELIVDPEWLLTNFGDAASSMATMIGAAVATGGGSEVAAFTGGMAEGSGLYKELLDDGVDGRSALYASTAFGYVVTRLEKIGLDRIFGKTATKGVVARFVRSIVTGGAEALSEYLEEPVQGFLGELARSGDFFEALKSGVEGFRNIDVLPGAFLVGGGVSYMSSSSQARQQRTVEKYEKIRGQITAGKAQQQQSEVEQKALMQLRADLEAADLQTRTPRAVENFVQEMVDEHGALPAHAYIDGGVLGAAIEQNTEEAQQVLDGLGISREDVTEATANGTDVVVPLKKYAAHVFGTQTDQMLMNDVRLSATTLTGSQMQIAQQEMAEEIKKQIAEIKELEAVETTFEQERQEIYEDVYEKVIKAGQTKEMAEKTATYWGALFGAYASRYSDGSPLALYRTVGLVTEQGEAQTGTENAQEQSLHQGKKLDVAMEYGRKVATAAKEWAQVVEAAVTGKLSKRAVMQVGATPDLLQELGLPDLPMVMKQATFKKITGQKAKRGSMHNMTADQVKSLYSELADPVAVLKYGENNYTVVTRQTEDGNPVIVGLDVDVESGNIKVNEITSAYGKNNFNGWLKTRTQKGDLVYIDQKEIAAILKDRSGPQLAGVLQARRVSGNKIRFATDVVKPVLEQTQNSGANAQVFLNIGVDQDTLISMFESADLSSFLHESGHIFFELLGYLANQPNASEAAKADWQEVLGYVADVEESTPTGVTGALKQNGISTDAEAQLAQDEAAFQADIDDFVNPKGTRHDKPLRVMHTPLVLQLLGAKSVDLIIRPNKLRRLMKEHPEITAGVIKRIPRAMANPIMVFDSATQSGRLVMMLDVKGADGSTVIVPVELVAKEGRYDVTVITTSLGKKPGWFLGQYGNGKLRYEDKKKSRAWKNLHRLQLPPGAPRNNSVHKILTEKDLVKARAANSKLYQEETETNTSRGSAPAGAAGLTVKQHEKLARTMEAYFMEGKAPSMTLRKVFIRFSDWLKDIYNNLAGLSQAVKQEINLTPEIIGVMERMFATDAEISQAQDYYGRKAEYKNLAAEVSEEEMQKYISAQQDAEDQARDSYLRQLVKEWASGTNNRKEIENKIKAELKGEVVYAVQTAIRDAGGLDIDGLDIAVGEALRKQLSKKRLTRQGGVSPEIIAAQYGYESVGRMAHEIVRAEKLNTRAARLTDQAVNAKLRKMQEGQPKAIEAVHGDASLQVLLMELEMLRRKRMPQGAESQLRNITITAKRNALREFAKQTIAAKTVTEARRYDVFSRAEARAAKDAEAALRKGDYAEAEQAKLRQITNHVLVLEAVRVREEIKAKVTKAKKKAKQKSSAENTRQLLRDIIIRFGMMSRRPGESFEAMIKRQHLNVEAFNQNIEEYNANLEEGAEKAKAVDFKAWEAWAKERGYEPVISPLVEDRAIAKPLGSLTVGEFRDIIDTVDSIAHADLEERTFILEGKRIDLDELVHKLIDKMSENYTPDQLRAAMKTFEKQQRDKSRKGSAKSKLAAFDAAMLHVEDLLYVLDGRELGIWHDTFMVLASEMEHRENELVNEMSDTINALFNKHFTKKQLRELHDPKKGVYIEEIGQTLTRAQLIRVGLDMGNEGNWLRRRDGHGWRDDQMHAIKDQLLEHELHFIQGIWDANETLRPEAFAVEQEISGVMPERVVATALETKYGVFPGGYFPSKIDPKYDIKKRQRDAAEDSLIFGDPNIGYTDVKHGSTKKRAKTAGNASLSPNLSDIGTHIYEVAHMIAYRRGVVQLGKLFRHGTFDEALQTYLGEEHGSVLLPWVKDMSAPPVLPTTPIDKMLRAIRLGMSVKSLAKFSVGAQQVAGLTSSAAKLGKKGNKNLVKYVAYYYGWPPRLWKDNAWINEKSKFMRDRMEHTTREVDDVFRGKSYQQANMEKLGNLAMKFLIGGPQKFFVDIVTWRAAYETALQGGKSEKGAIKYADHLVRTSQAGGGKKDQSEIQRSQSEGTKAVTYFFSFMNKAYNIASVNLRGKNKSYGEAAWVALMLFIIGPTAAEFLSGRQPDEDEDESVHFWAAKNTARFASGMIPVIGDVTEMAITGFEPSSPAFSPLGSAGKVIGHSIEYAQGEREITRNTIKALMDVVGVWTKMPTDQMYITGTGMYDLMTDHPEAHVKDLVFKPKDRR